MAILYFKKDEKNITFTGPYMEAYIPTLFFEKGIAELVGDYFKTLGMFTVRIFKDQDGKYPAGDLKLLNVPMELTTYPSAGFTENVDITTNGVTENCTVLKYYTGDVFMHSIIPCNTDVFTSIIQLLLQGKFPNIIPYDKVLDVWEKSFEANKAFIDIPDMIKEIVVSQIYRDKHDLNTPFGKVVGKNPKTNMLDYVTVNPRELSISNSNFTGMIFEDMEQMLVGGMVNTKKNRKQTSTPMEEVMTY